MASQSRRLSMGSETVHEIQQVVVNFTYEVSDNILKRFPLMNDVLRLLEATTGLKKRYIIIALVSHNYLSFLCLVNIKKICFFLFFLYSVLSC